MDRNETAAFVIHTAPAGEHGLRLDLISPEYGRITVWSRNGRSRRSQVKAMVQLFSPLRIVFREDGNSRILCGCTAAGMPFTFQPPYLFAALYINELTALLLREEGEGPLFFAAYLRTISDLSELEHRANSDEFNTEQQLEIILRRFELEAVACCGFELDWRYDFISGTLIDPKLNYILEPDNGFREHTVCDDTGNCIVFSGSDIQAVARRRFDVQGLKAAKKICRILLAHLLEGRCLNSRLLYQAYLQRNMSVIKLP